MAPFVGMQVLYVPEKESHLGSDPLAAVVTGVADPETVNVGILAGHYHHRTAVPFVLKDAPENGNYCYQLTVPDGL